MRKLVLTIQHRLNPLHLYCRMVEKGWNKKCCMSMCKWYQILIYSWFTKLSVAAVRTCKDFR